MILAWTGDELSCWQAQNGVTLDFEVKFDLEGQGQSPLKIIGFLTKVFYTYGLNLVILARMGDELSRGQASDYRTHGRTDVLWEKHKCIVMRIDEDSSAYSESFKRVECTNWEYRRVRATHQLPVPQTHWFAVSVW